MSSKQLRIENDSCLYFKTDSEETPTGQIQQEMIKKLNINYSGFELKTVYVDSDVKDTIKAFNVDYIKQKIMIVCQSVTMPANVPFYVFKIYDLVRQDIEFAIEIRDKELIGRLLSGLYTFVDGHIFFNNNVIKIRYDLLAKSGITTHNE